MTLKMLTEYFIIGLPYCMAVVFISGATFRLLIWYTVKRHEWFARQFELRVNNFMSAESPGKKTQVSFYVLSKRLLEKTFYECFAIRDRMKRRRGDAVMGMSDRVFLVKPGCAWMVKDIQNQLKFLKWTTETPKLLRITRATFLHNPFFNSVFGVFPIAALNDMVTILPGLFVVAGILGTFIGIAGGLHDLGGMDMQDLEHAKNIMDQFLGQISFAMKTSIFGIIFSLCSHVINTIISPDRVYASMVDRFENSLDLLWYRSENNDFPVQEKAFDEHRDPVEALASHAIEMETKRFPGTRSRDEERELKSAS